MTIEIRCPSCPLCDGPPSQEFVCVLTWPGQAWCDNSDCDVMCWDATKTLDENIMNASGNTLP